MAEARDGALRMQRILTLRRADRGAIGCALDRGHEDGVARGLGRALLAPADHRSIPPSTGSSIASVAMRSAMEDPSVIGAVAWRFTNDGSRMWTRAGLLEPSERTKQPSSPRGDSIG